MTSDRRAEIAKRAYSFWETENHPTGKDLEHWLRAEAEFETEQAQPAKEAPPKPRRPAAKRGKRTPHGKAED